MGSNCRSNAERLSDLATLHNQVCLSKEGAIVRRAEATAEVFMTAFESLPKSDRGAVLQRLFADPALKEDLIDVATWYERQAERAIPYKRVRESLKKAGRL